MVISDHCFKNDQKQMMDMPMTTMSMITIMAMPTTNDMAMTMVMTIAMTMTMVFTALYASSVFHVLH